MIVAQDEPRKPKPELPGSPSRPLPPGTSREARQAQREAEIRATLQGVQEQADWLELAARVQSRPPEEEQHA